MEIILGIVSAVLGCSTLVGWMFYRSANRRIKDAEADKANAEADAAQWDLYEKRLEATHKSIDVLNSQLEAQIKLAARKEDIIEDKTQVIRKLQDALSSLQNERLKDANEISELKQERDFYKLWHCQREHGGGKDECVRRKPPQKIPIKYIPYNLTVKETKEDND